MIPDIEITENGIIAPTTDEVLAGVWEILKTAFGSNLLNPFSIRYCLIFFSYIFQLYYRAAKLLILFHFT